MRNPVGHMVDVLAPIYAIIIEIENLSIDSHIYKGIISGNPRISGILYLP